MNKFHQENLSKIQHGGFKSLLKKALDMGVKVNIIKESPSIFKLQYKDKIIFCKKSSLPIQQNSNLVVNKHFTKAILNNMGIKTPKGIKASSLNEALKLLNNTNLRYPLILKPLNDSLARGVVWNIKNKTNLKDYIIKFIESRKKDNKKTTFLIEEMYIGNEYRILILDGKILGCVHKIPASVTGDGKSTIDQLIKKFNQTRKKDLKITMDSVVKNTLKKNNLNLNSILEENETLKLRNNLNMSDGGRSVDYTKQIHPFFKKISADAVKYCGLSYGGLDLMTEDISKKTDDYVILEINSNPYYNMHETPLIEGDGADISKKILLKFFPNIKKKK